jgi:hypothetical protein
MKKENEYWLAKSTNVKMKSIVKILIERKAKKLSNASEERK